MVHQEYETTWWLQKVQQLVQDQQGWGKGVDRGDQEQYSSIGLDATQGAGGERQGGQRGGSRGRGRQGHPS